MESEQFDRFARRAVLRGTLASAVLGLFGSLSLIEGEAKKKKKKKKKCRGNKKKCGKRCIPKDQCCNSGDCLADEVCDDGLCIESQTCFGRCGECGDDGCGRQCVNNCAKYQICTEQKTCVCPEGTQVCFETFACEFCCYDSDCGLGQSCRSEDGGPRRCLDLP